MFSGIGGFEKGIDDAQKIDKTKPKCTGFTSDGQQQKITTVEPSATCLSNQIQQPNQPKEWSNNANWQCIGYSEIDKYASSIYRYHYPNHTNYGDATKLVPEQLPDSDCIVGGFPCQSFSIAGKRESFSDIRGTLFFEICRIAKAKRTPYLWLENVKGLLSAPYTEDVETWDEEDFDANGEPTPNAKRKHKAISGTKGWVFLTILNTLWELGYDCQWQVLNSKNHGVPQNRERVLIIGHLRGISRPQVFPIGETNNNATETDINNVGLIVADYSNDKGFNGNNYRPRHRILGVDGIGRAISTCENQMPYIIHTAYPGEVREYADIPPTVSTPSGGRHLPMVAQALQTDGQLRQGSSWGTDKPQSSRNIRRLTPIECERLQGFPDGWTKYGLTSDGKAIEISDTQRYKCCGNAVTTNVIRDIAEQWMLWIKKQD